MPTPSVNQIASLWVLRQLSVKKNALTLDPDYLSELSDSRVNEAKADKVCAQVQKITAKLVERCRKIRSKIGNPTRRVKESVTSLNTHKRKPGRPPKTVVKSKHKHREEEE